MDLDKKELKKLSPEKRIEKLKEIEEETEKELEDAKDLIKTTEAEIKWIKIPNIQIPDLKPVDISRMFDREQEGLEMTVQKEAPTDSKEGPVIHYMAPQAEAIVESRYGASDAQIKHTLTIKFDDTIKYKSEADKMSDGSASRSVLENMKKYSMG